MPQRRVKVFISYSHDSGQHIDHVRSLSDRLRADGIDSNLDQYEPAPPMGWLHWMEENLLSSDFIIVVCTGEYLRRALGGQLKNRGLGTKFESSLILNDLYASGMQNKRIIPIIFREADRQNIIGPLKHYTFYLLDSDLGYERLYRHLTEQPESPKPELGAVKRLPQREAISFEPSNSKLKPLATATKSPPPQADTGPSLPRQQARSPALAILLTLILAISLSTTFLYSNRPVDIQSAESESTFQILEGEVRDAESNSPLAGVTITLPRYGQIQETNKFGRYKFLLAVPEGTRINLRAHLEGYRSIEHDPMIGGNDTWIMRSQE